MEKCIIIIIIYIQENNQSSKHSSKWKIYLGKTHSSEAYTVSFFVILSIARQTGKHKSVQKAEKITKMGSSNN